VLAQNKLIIKIIINITVEHHKVITRGAGVRQCATGKREERKPGRRGMSLVWT